MSRKTIEQKLLVSLENSVADTRFSRYLFGQLASSSDLRKEIFQTSVAFIEMMAIHADYGDFEARDAEVMLLSRKIRNLLVEEVMARREIVGDI